MYKNTFFMENKIIAGIITKGLGEGAYFMNLSHYKNEIKKILKIDAYPGTLNLKINIDDFKLLIDLQKLRIEGYEQNGKKFGGATCYKIKIKDVNGFIIVPDINKHKDVLEVIAPIHL